MPFDLGSRQAIGMIVMILVLAVVVYLILLYFKPASLTPVVSGLAMYEFLKMDFRKLLSRRKGDIPVMNILIVIVVAVIVIFIVWAIINVVSKSAPGLGGDIGSQIGEKTGV